MKKFNVTALGIILAVLLAACGNNGGNANSQAAGTNGSNESAKQQEIEQLQAEADKLKEELAEKEAAEKEAEAAAAEEQAAQEASPEETQTAEAMRTIISYYVDGEDIDEKTYNYIVDHHELFPAVTPETKKAAAAEVDPNVTTRHIIKNINPYLDKMVEISGYVVQIQEEETDIGTVAEIHIMDENENSIVGEYMNSTGDILDGDFVTLRGVPTTLYSFENVSGGTTNAILLTVSTIQKSE
ncbi:hypothetical protein [Fontibacillus sp. BL9]|uniref:hypothetical protein n=1 Tax=Fontibacillus sp. BL9 TaxID=3389971 RepID=UPI00397B80FD